MERTHKDKMVVVLYHDVTDSPSEFVRENGLFVTPQLFEYQMSVIRRHFRILAPEDLSIEGFGQRVSALITFDDVFRGAFINAAPILDRHGIPAVFFLNYGDMEDGLFWSGLLYYLLKHDCRFRPTPLRSPFGRRLPLISSVTPDYVKKHLTRFPVNRDEVERYIGDFARIDDLDECARQYDCISYGNHLYRHYNANTLSNQELTYSYLLNDMKIRRLPNHLPFFSFPFGQPRTCFTVEAVEAIRSAGAEYVFSAFPLINKMPVGDVIHRVHLDESHNTEDRILRRLLLKGIKPKMRKAMFSLLSCPDLVPR